MDQPLPSNRRLRLAKLGLLLASTILALAAVELGLRIDYHRRRAKILGQFAAPDGRPTMIPSDVPGLIYTHAPYLCGANSRGYLDEEHALEKPPGVFRIVVIGDSVSLGHGVGPGQSFVKLLERDLNRSPAGVKCEAVVLAQSGYGTSQELVLLGREAFAYHPDLILWSYVLNDPADPFYDNAAGELRLLYEPRIHLLHLAGRAWFTAKEAILDWGGPKEYHLRLHHIYWDEVAANVARIGALCREHHAPAVFVIHPIFELDKDFDHYALAELHAKLANLASASGLAPVDLLAAYRGRRANDLSLPHDCWHPNALGHRLAADFLRRKLIEDGRLPGGGAIGYHEQ